MNEYKAYGMHDHLTPRQRQILELIKAHINEKGMPPTRAEIARILGFRSANAAEDHLRALARHGVIELTPGRSRGIRLLGHEALVSAGVGLPIVGRVAAGCPVLAIEHIEDHCRVAPELFHPHADYLLRVRGSSMQDAGILDGDLLVVHATQEARDGQIVVARMGEEVTVKRLQRDRRRPYLVQLLAENPSFAPIDLDLREQELVIEGIGVGVLRLGLGIAL